MGLQPSSGYNLLIGSAPHERNSYWPFRCRRLLKSVRVEKRSVFGDSVRNSGVHY